MKRKKNTQKAKPEEFGLIGYAPKAFSTSILSGAMPALPSPAGVSNTPSNSQAIGSIDSSPESQTGIDYFSVCLRVRDVSKTIDKISTILGIYFEDTNVVTASQAIGTVYLSRACLGSSIQFRLAPDGEWVVRLSLPGSACGVISGYVWWELFGFIRSHADYSVTRIDFKADDRENILDLDTIAHHLAEGSYSGFRGGEVIKSYGGARAGTTVYFGGRKSELRVRFYDKAAESGVEGAGVRQELQIRGKRAAQAFDSISKLVGGQGIWEYGRKVLGGVMKFGSRRGKNINRMLVADFWQQWVEKLGAPPMREIPPRPVTSVERSLKWLVRTAATALSKLEIGLGAEKSAEFVRKLVAKGTEKLRSFEIEELEIFIRQWRGVEFESVLG